MGGHGLNGLARQGVEIVGAAELGFAGFDGEPASGGDRTRQTQLARCVQRQLGASTGEHGRGTAEARARNHRAAREQVHIAAGAELDHRGRRIGLHIGRAAQDEGRTGIDRDARAAAGGLEASGTHHRAAGAELQHAVGAGDAQAATAGTKEADLLAALADVAARTGRALDVERDAVLGDQPSRDAGLLGHGQIQRDGAQTGVGRAQRRLEVERAHFEQAALGADLGGRAHIAGHHNLARAQAQVVGEHGAEVEDANLGILGVANDEEGIGPAVANADFAEAVPDGVQIAHGQGHKAGVAGHRLVAAEQRLASSADAVVLAFAAGADAQDTGTRDLVAARGEVDVVGHQGDGAAATCGTDHTAVQAQQRLARVELHFNAAAAGEQATRGPTVGHHLQAVGLAHHQVGDRAAAGFQADGGHLGVELAHQPVGADAEQGVFGQELGTGDVHRAGGAQREVGGLPVHVHGLQHRAGRDVFHLDAVQRLIKTQAEVAGVGLVRELQLAQGQGSGACQRRHAHHVEARAAGDLDVAAAVVGIDEDDIAPVAGGHLAVAAAQDDGVVARTGADVVVAQAHVDGDATASAHKTVVAGGAGVAAHPGVATDRPVVAEVIDASGHAVEELVVARTARNHTASTPTLDQEAVVAATAVEIEHRIDTLADVEGVVAAAAKAPNGLDPAAGVALLHPERAHDVLIAPFVKFDRHPFVDDLVVLVLTVTARRIAHVEHQGVALHAADAGWVGPGPEIAARHRNAHHRHPRRQIGAGRRDVDFATEAGKGEVDAEQPQIKLEVQRTPHRRCKTRFAAQQQAGTGVEVQRPHVDVDLDLAAELKIALRVDEAAHLDRGDVEEVERAVELELEHLVDHAHAAVEIDIEQENVDQAVELQIEQGVAFDDIALQRGVVQRAGVDAQGGIGLDLQDRDIHLGAEVQVQRKERAVVGVHPNSGCAGHLDFTEGAEVEHHLHGHLQARAVDEEIDRAAHGDGAHRHLGLAADLERARREVNHDRLALFVVHIALSVAAACLLHRAGGVDLQQEAPADAEHIAAVEDDRVAPGTTDLQAAVEARATGIHNQAQGAGGIESGQRLDRQVGAHTQLQAEGVVGVGGDEREVALELQQAQQVERTLADEGHIRTDPAGLAGRVGAHGEAVEAGAIAQLLGHHIDDVAAKGVQAELEGHIQAADRPQVQAAGEVHAHGHAAAVDDDQAGGITLQAKAVWTHLHRHVGKGGQALLLAEAEIERAVELDQAEHVDLDLAKNAQEIRAEVEHDGLEGVAGLNGIARQRHLGVQQAVAPVLACIKPAVVVEVLARIEHAVAPVLAEVKHTVAVGVFSGSHPAALAEVDGGEAKRGLHIRVVADRAGDLVAGDFANVQAGTYSGVDLQRHVARGHGHTRHAVEHDGLHIGAAGDVDANAHPLQREIGFRRYQQTQVKVLHHQTNGAAVDLVVLVDAIVAIAVVEIAARGTVHHRGHTQEGVGIVDADGHGGDDGFLAVGQRHPLARALGEGHGARHLQHTGQVHLGIADLGLDDLLVKVDEHHVVAARRQGKTGAVDLAVLVAVFAEVQLAIAVQVLTRVQAQVGVEVFAKIKHTVAVEVFGEVLEALAFLVVDGGWTKNLQRQGELGRVGNNESVDVDFDVEHLGREDVVVDAHQASALDRGLGRHPERRESLQRRNHGQLHRRHDGKAEVHVVDFQAHRAFVDQIKNAILVQVGAIAVRPADAHKAFQVRAAQGHGLDVEVDVVEVDARDVAEVAEHRLEPTRIDLDVVNLALAEGQRAAQVHKVGHGDLGQADVQAHHGQTVEVEHHRLAAGAHHMATALGGLQRDGVEHHRHHVGINGQRPHKLHRHPGDVDLRTPEAAVVEFQRDVAAQDLEEIAKTVGTKFVGRGLERHHRLFGALEQSAPDARQHRGVDADGQIQVLQAEADQALLGQRTVEVGAAATADENVDVAGTKGHPLVVDVVENTEVLRHAQQALHHIGVAEIQIGAQASLDQLLGGQVQQAVDRAAEHGVDPGKGVGSEVVAQGELEVALEVDEVPDVDNHVGDFERAGDAGDADAQLDVLQRIDRILQPSGRRIGNAEVKVHQP